MSCEQGAGKADLEGVEASRLDAVPGDIAPQEMPEVVVYDIVKHRGEPRRGSGVWDRCGPRHGNWISICWGRTAVLAMSAGSKVGQMGCAPQIAPSFSDLKRGGLDGGFVAVSHHGS